MAPLLHRREPGLPDGHLVLLRQPPPVLQVGPPVEGRGGGWLAVMPLRTDGWDTVLEAGKGVMAPMGASGAGSAEPV